MTEFVCPHTGADEPCMRCDNEMLVDENQKLRAEVDSLKETEARLLEHLDAKTGDCVHDEQWDDIWHLAHPNNTQWEYPSQVIRELRHFVERLQSIEAAAKAYVDRPSHPQVAGEAWRDLCVALDRNSS